MNTDLWLSFLQVGGTQVMLIFVIDRAYRLIDLWIRTRPIQQDIYGPKPIQLTTLYTPSTEISIVRKSEEK